MIGALTILVVVVGVDMFARVVLTTTLTSEEAVRSAVSWVPDNTLNCDSDQTDDGDGRYCFTYTLQALNDCCLISVRLITATILAVQLKSPRVPRQCLAASAVVSAMLMPCALLQYRHVSVALTYGFLLLIDQVVMFRILFWDQLFWSTLPVRVDKV